MEKSWSLFIVGAHNTFLTEYDSTLASYPIDFRHIALFTIARKVKLTLQHQLRRVAVRKLGGVAKIEEAYT